MNVNVKKSEESEAFEKLTNNVLGSVSGFRDCDRHDGVNSNSSLERVLSTHFGGHQFALKVLILVLKCSLKV